MRSRTLKTLGPHLSVLAALTLVLGGCGGSDRIQIARTSSSRCRSVASQYQSFRRDVGPVLRDPSNTTAGRRVRTDAEKLKATLAEFVPHADVDRQAALSQYRAQLRDFELQLSTATGANAATAKQVMASIARQMTGLKPLLEALCKG